MIVLAIGSYLFLKPRIRKCLIVKSSKQNLVFLILGVDFYKALNTGQ